MNRQEWLQGDPAELANAVEKMRRGLNAASKKQRASGPQGFVSAGEILASLGFSFEEKHSSKPTSPDEPAQAA